MKNQYYFSHYEELGNLKISVAYNSKIHQEDYKQIDFDFPALPRSVKELMHEIKLFIEDKQQLDERMITVISDSITSRKGY